MDCKTTERITFEQRLFAREALAQRWPALDKFICSAAALEAAPQAAAARTPQSSTAV